MDLRIYRNYEDPHHISNQNKKKKDHKDESEEKDKKQEVDIIIGDKDDYDSRNKIRKTKINGHEWITFRNMDSKEDDEDDVDMGS